MRAQFVGAPVLAPHLPGYGDAPMLEAYTLDAAAEALAKAAETPVDLVGWSLGGLIAMQWAVSRPAQVRRLVLLNATPCFVAQPGWVHGVPSATLRLFHAQLAREPATLMARFQGLQAQGVSDPDALAAKLRAHEAAASPAALQASLALLGTHDLRAAFASLVQPTLILHGSLDAVTPVGAAQGMAAQLPHARLQHINDGGHALPVSHAEACAERISSFLHE
jgi:pimeloyl-[acyl-carrier protein] methyl ester esterase